MRITGYHFRFTQIVSYSSSNNWAFLGVYSRHTITKIILTHFGNLSFNAIFLFADGCNFQFDDRADRKIQKFEVVGNGNIPAIRMETREK